MQIGKTSSMGKGDGDRTSGSIGLWLDRVRLDRVRRGSIGVRAKPGSRAYGREAGRRWAVGAGASPMEIGSDWDLGTSVLTRPVGKSRRVVLTSLRRPDRGGPCVLEIDWGLDVIDRIWRVGNNGDPIGKMERPTEMMMVSGLV